MIKCDTNSSDPFSFMILDIYIYIRIYIYSAIVFEHPISGAAFFEAEFSHGHGGTKIPGVRRGNGTHDDLGTHSASK